jgi:pimeloyl-ACP methyl ester carboxylesterase
MTRPDVARFTSEAAREKFLRAYDEAMRLWPEPWRELDVETSFGTVHVYRYGPETGEPIVLLHGHGASASMWYAQVAALGAHHPVYALDTIDDPGRSVQRVAVTGSEDNAAWIDEVLARLGLDRVHLVGLSYGGWLTLGQGIHRPERLASITALDPGGLQKVRLAFYVSMVAGLFALGAPRRMRPWLARRLANSALIFPRELLAPIRLSALAFKPDRPPARSFTDEELRAIRVPSLVLLAQRSVLLHATTALTRVERLIPGVRAEIVPDADHGLPLEYPDLVNARILRFIEVEAPSPRIDGGLSTRGPGPLNAG